MFCLRNWIALLVFLTNASPLYVILFLTATYALQRPCVYCSILLFVLIFSLFDFHANWFESRLKFSPSTSFSETATQLFSGNATLAEALRETASIAVCAINGTGGSLASVAMEGVKRRMAGVAVGGGERYSAEAVGSGFEWLRGLLEKWQFRIPCVDVVVRL